MPPYRLNSFEQQTLQNLQKFLPRGLDPSLGMGIVDQTVGNATARRQTNLQERQEGLASLENMAVQLAQGGAEQGALAGTIEGMASELPLTNSNKGGEKVDNLMDLVGGMYDKDSDISGLASPDMQAQFGGNTQVLDEEDKAMIFQQAAAAFENRVPLADVQQEITSKIIATGLPESAEAEAAQYAQEAYERLLEQGGTSLGQVQSLASQARAAGSTEDVFGGDTQYNQPASIIMNRLLSGVTPGALQSLIGGPSGGGVGGPSSQAGWSPIPGQIAPGRYRPYG